MDQVDLLSIGSYTELPGGNIALPQGYSSLLAPIINVCFPCFPHCLYLLLTTYFISAQNIPAANILKQHPITRIHWQHGQDTADQGDADSDDGSDCSVSTVKSVGRRQLQWDTARVTADVMLQSARRWTRVRSRVCARPRCRPAWRAPGAAAGTGRRRAGGAVSPA